MEKYKVIHIWIKNQLICSVLTDHKRFYRQDMDNTYKIEWSIRSCSNHYSGESIFYEVNANNYQPQDIIHFQIFNKLSAHFYRFFITTNDITIQEDYCDSSVSIEVN